MSEVDVGKGERERWGPFLVLVGTATVLGLALAVVASFGAGAACHNDLDAQGWPKAVCDVRYAWGAPLLGFVLAWLGLVGAARTWARGDRGLIRVAVLWLVAVASGPAVLLAVAAVGG